MSYSRKQVKRILHVEKPAELIFFMGTWAGKEGEERGKLPFKMNSNSPMRAL